MHTHAASLSVRDAYALLTSLVVPRPIAWISTSMADGRCNLAPFSYYQALCSDPPMVTVSVADARGGGASAYVSPAGAREKDTLRLARASGRFVVNLVEEHDLERMNSTSAELGVDDSEADTFGIAMAPFYGVGRVASSRAAFGCCLIDERRYGKTSGVTLMVGEIEEVYVDDAIIDEDGRVRGEALSPVARLEGPHYALGGRRVALARPKAQR